jgi:polysaccharide export outer membrane protein
LDTTALRYKEPVIKSNDLLSIQVLSKSLNQEQASIFNILNTGGNTSNSSTNSNAISGYQVSHSGTIEMPVIGTLKVSGLTKSQLQDVLVQKISPFVKDPSVVIRFQQFTVNVLGEVKSPGSRIFQTDKVTLIDALSSAGDLTDYGKRNDIMVIREEEGKRSFYNVDMTNGALFHSPAYQLQPNDIVYVGANKNKLKNLNVDPDAQRRTGLIFSIISVAVGLGTFFISALK